MKKIAIIVLCGLVLGCAKKAPECGSDKAKSLVLDATKDFIIHGYTSSIKNNLNLNEFNNWDEVITFSKEKAIEQYNNADVKLDIIRTDSVDDVALKSSCSADIVDNMENRNSITYTLQLTEDGRIVTEVYKDRS